MEQLLPFIQKESYSGFPTDVLQKGGQTFQQLLTTGQLGNLYGPGTSLLKGFSGNGFDVGDETGKASISPSGNLQIAGKYSAIGLNPYERKVSASYTNPDNTFSIGGSYGMGPQNFYNPTGNINFRFGQGSQPVMTPGQIEIQGLPESEQEQLYISPARAYEMQQTSNYQQNNPGYYRQY